MVFLHKTMSRMAIYTKTTLGAIASVSAGYAFRTTIKTSDKGVLVVQMKDTSKENGLRWDDVIRTELPGRAPKIWLEDEDLLFLARGNNNYSVCIRDVMEKTVCSPHFFHIRITDPTITAVFLNWQINQLPAQNYIDASAEGQEKRNIRRTVLEDLPIIVPSIPKQNEIIKLDELLNDERMIYEAMMANRHDLMDSIAIKLYAGDIEGEKDAH